MKFKNIKEALQFRIDTSEDLYYIDDYWSATIKIATENLSNTILFIKNDCNDEEFYWFSEIFEEIVDITKSKDFINELILRLKKVHKDDYNQKNFKSKHMRNFIDYETYVKDIKKEIEYAEDYLDE